MTSPERGPPIDVVRAALREHAERVTRRTAAAQVGMSLGGLHHFLAGGSPRESTRRKLTGWYLHTLSKHPDASSSEAVEAALDVLLEPVLAKARPAARRSVLSVIAEACRASGVRVPNWARTEGKPE